MNIYAYIAKMDTSHRAFSLMCPNLSQIAATRRFHTRKVDTATSRKEASVPFNTFADIFHEPYPLTRREAYSFVEQTLRLKHPGALYKTNPLQNLTKVAERIKKISPYTTMHFWDGSVFQFDDEYGKHQILRGHGGGCPFISPFTQALLGHLGYKTYDLPALGNVTADHFHISTLVEDVCHTGSLHLIELGTVRPLFHPVSLDFAHESPVYEVFGLRNKFFKSKDGNLVWCVEPLPKMLHKLDDHEVIQDSTGTKWQIYLIYLLKEKNLGRSYFSKYWQKLLKGEGYIPPRTDGFLYNAYKDGNLVNVFAGKHKIFVQIIQQDATEDTRKLTKEELLRFFESNFPGFPTRMVSRAIRNNFHMLRVSRGS